MNDRYHYTECGLDNVWLVNGFTLHETEYGMGVSIVDARSLHEALGCALIKKEGRLTGKEFRFLRGLLGLSQGTLASIHGVTENTISNWERGKGDIPTANEAMLRLCYQEQVAGDTALNIAMRRVKHLERRIHENERIIAMTASGRWSSSLEESTEAA